MPNDRALLSQPKRDTSASGRLTSSSSSSSASTSAASSPSPSPAPSASRFPAPSSAPRWSQQSGRNSSGRLSATVARSSSTLGLGLGGGADSFIQRNWELALHYGQKTLDMFQSLPLLYKAIVVLALLVLVTLVGLILLYTEKLFTWLATVSSSWRALTGGWLIAFALICMTSVPPVIGYSTANTITGFVYGFPLGWPIAAAACVVGSLAAFIACRTVLSKHVNKLIGNDPRFVALGQVLRQDGLLYLTGIRFCPLPFSLSNGFLATIPSITPLSFALSTAISTPKLLIHVFIGSRLAILAEDGGKMSLKDKLINYTSIVIGGAIGAAAGYIIYRRTMARAAEIARENAFDAAAEEGLGGYEDADADETLMDPEDAANIMGDDDVSLWDTQVDDGWGDERADDGDGTKKSGSQH